MSIPKEAKAHPGLYSQWLWWWWWYVYTHV